VIETKIELAFQNCSNTPIGHLSFVLGKCFRISEEDVRAILALPISEETVAGLDYPMAKDMLYRAVDTLASLLPGEDTPSEETIRATLLEVLRVLGIGSSPGIRRAWAAVLRTNPSFVGDLSQFIHDNWDDLQLIAEPPDRS